MGVNWAYTFMTLLSGINCHSEYNNLTVSITLMLDATSRPNSDGISLRDEQDYIRVGIRYVNKKPRESILLTSAGSQDVYSSSRAAGEQLPARSTHTAS